MKGWDSVGCVGNSVTDVRGASRSMKNQYLDVRKVHNHQIRRTFKADGRVWVAFGSGSDSILYSLVVIVAIDVVSVLVDERWIAAYDGPAITSVLDLLIHTISIGFLEATRLLQSRTDMPLCRRTALWAGPACLRGQTWPSASICCLGL